MVTDFQKRVYSAVKKIPCGEIRTYKTIARAAGNPKAARAAGNALSKNHDPEIPCHRVVRSDRGTGGYNRGAAKKSKLLGQEGVSIVAGRVIM